LIDNSDGDYLLKLLKAQFQNPKEYLLDNELYEKYLTRTTTVHQTDVPVSIPEDTENHSSEVITEKEVRESVKIQALLALIGEKWGSRFGCPGTTVIWSCKNGNQREMFYSTPFP